LEEADKNISAGEANYQAMKNMLRREVKDRFTMLNIYRRKLKLYDASLLSSANSALEGSLAGYRGGKIEFMLLLDSFRTYLDINKEYYETLADYYTKLAELEEITGGSLQ
jgi:cobalt-zinc-cadmium efflux system outer membrane protein